MNIGEVKFLSPCVLARELESGKLGLLTGLREIIFARESHSFGGFRTSNTRVSATRQIFPSYIPLDPLKDTVSSPVPQFERSLVKQCYIDLGKKYRYLDDLIYYVAQIPLDWDLMKMHEYNIDSESCQLPYRFLETQEDGTISKHPSRHDNGLYRLYHFEQHSR
ncbi:hypothetical protein HZH68_016223 [Vespula germanica]|uniref:Uncharacterized protein n=1 Tax=Vespula germanica TaxID=30212 RepID=A0A834MRK1_VESGE|nr:hypothetical protein HZH68_016223 [Vespula germanica]